MLVPSGAFTYYSYRDPNSLDTFSVFNQSADWVLGDNFGQAEVEEAVLRVFQVENIFHSLFPAFSHTDPLHRVLTHQLLLVIKGCAFSSLGFRMKTLPSTEADSGVSRWPT